LDQFRGARGGVSLVRALQETFPKRLVEVSVLVPRSVELRYGVRLAGGGSTEEPTVEVRDQDAVYRWRLEDLPGLQARPLPPPLAERSAHLVLSTMSSWRQVAEWYRGLLEQQATEAPDMLAQVQALAGDPAPSTAVARFVADDVRYVGLEFGVNAYVPYPAARVFERRYGDCKDKSLLMVTLLRRLGIDAHMVLVRTFPHGSLQDPPPSISLFDHAIVRIPESDVWFDPTARYMGTGGLPWQDQGAQALVLDDDPGIEVIPEAPATDNRADLHLVFRSGPAGDLEVAGTASFTGAQARANFELAQDPGEWDSEVERYITGLVPGFHLGEAPWEVRSGPEPLLRVAVEGSLESEGDAALPLFGGMRFLQRLAGLAERDEDLVLRFPFMERIILETDAAGLLLSGPDRDAGDGPGCRWEVRTTATRAEVQVEILARRVAAGDYAAFRACLRSLDTALALVRLRTREEETP
jgi:hypothetical protein